MNFDLADSSQVPSPAATKPSLLDDLNRLIDRIVRKPERETPKQFVDWKKVKKHKIKMGYDSFSDTWLMSSSEMRRAEKVGAIWNKPEIF
jgi:hypothetical protein